MRGLAYYSQVKPRSLVDQALTVYNAGRKEGDNEPFSAAAVAVCGTKFGGYYGVAGCGEAFGRYAAVDGMKYCLFPRLDVLYPSDFLVAF